MYANTKNTHTHSSRVQIFQQGRAIAAATIHSTMLFGNEIANECAIQYFDDHTVKLRVTTVLYTTYIYIHLGLGLPLSPISASSMVAGAA